jgi:uncharacterized protein involved in response to NO
MALISRRSTEGWPLLSAGFRPFFLCAGLWSAFSMTLWIFMLRSAVQLPTAFGPVVWHFHEFLFGFVTAAIAGFLLTAIPNWTGRLPLQGSRLGVLVLLWMSGRVSVAFSAEIGPTLAMAIDLTFLVVFAAVVTREILVGRNWRNLPVVIALSLLIAANALMHVGSVDVGERLGISVVVMLISLIGGRIIPSFTTNWLRRRQAESFPVPFGTFDKATLAFSFIALAAWVVIGLNAVSGAALLIAAAAHAVRLARWRGGATLEEPLLTILHLGYAWLPIGLGLLGTSAWFPSLATSAIHALTVGAMGTMILAVMTRASLGHTKRELAAGYGTSAVYLLVLAAAVVRFAAPYSGAAYAGALDLAAGLWIAAFALFVALYAPLYMHR